MHFDQDPDGRLGLSGRRWHAGCARPFWEDRFSSVLRMLGGAGDPAALGG